MHSRYVTHKLGDTPQTFCLSDRTKRQAVNSFEVIFDEAETICQVIFLWTQMCEDLMIIFTGRPWWYAV